MQTNNGDDTSHKLTGKGVPEKFNSLKKAFMDAKSKWWAETMHKRWLEMLPSSEDSTGVTLMSLWVLVIMLTDVIGFTLETKDRLFVSIIFLFLFIGSLLDHFRKESGSLTRANRSLLANKIQHERRLFYWLQLVSAWICIVLSMMGLYSQYYGETQVTNMVTTHHINLRFFYLMTIGICAKWWVETMHKRWLEILPSSEDLIGVTLMCWWALVIMLTDVIGFTLETKDRLFVSIIFLFLFIGLVLDYFREASGSLKKANRSLLANKIQHERIRLFYWLQLVSVWICVVLSMMGLYSQYYGQIEAKNMVTIHHINLRFFYLMTIGICAIKIIIIMRLTVTDELLEGATDQNEMFGKKC